MAPIHVAPQRIDPPPDRQLPFEDAYHLAPSLWIRTGGPDSDEVPATVSTVWAQAASLGRSISTGRSGLVGIAYPPGRQSRDLTLPRIVATITLMTPVFELEGMLLQITHADALGVRIVAAWARAKAHSAVEQSAMHVG